MGEIKPHYSERQILADVVPLEIPYSIQCEPSQYCNLKCNYCMQSLIPQKNRHIMSREIFETLCARIQVLGKLKQFNFAGWGEPLINMELPGMVRYLKQLAITDNIAIITNGLLLMPSLSDELVAAGVDHMRISVQGMTSENYRLIGGKQYNPENLVKNIKYLYEHRGNCKVSAKIADIALDGEQEFYDTFGPITDQMYIESIRPMFPENKQDGKVISKYGIDHPPVITCPMPFYMMSVTATGEIFPCCHYYKPITLGNIKTHSLKAAWESKEMRDLWKMLLDGGRLSNHNYPVCRDCLMPDAILTPGDYLDDRAEEIKRRLM